MATTSPQMASVKRSVAMGYAWIPLPSAMTEILKMAMAATKLATLRRSISAKEAGQPLEISAPL